MKAKAQAAQGFHLEGLREEMQAVHRTLEELIVALPVADPPRRRGAWVTSALVTGALVLGAVSAWSSTRWAYRDQQRQVRMVQQLDAVIMQYWPTLPRAMQEHVTRIYKAAQYLPPGQHPAVQKGKP